MKVKITVVLVSLGGTSNTGGSRGDNRVIIGGVNVTMLAVEEAVVVLFLSWL